METGNRNDKRQPLIDRIVEFYLQSSEFNGVPFYTLQQEFGSEVILPLLEAGVQNGDFICVFGDRHPNPHVLALPPEDISAQVSKLRTDLLAQACVYPSPVLLHERVDVNSYVDRPFTLELALGNPCLSPRFFDLSVLERYRNDPRYHYYASDTDGYISINGTPENPTTLRTHDQVLLQSFGFGHDKAVTHRVVVVYLSYLNDLTPEHQTVWKTYLLDGEFYVHPAYSEATAGIWSDNIGIFEAVRLELQTINEMCEKIGKPRLFREDFPNGELPKHFAFLLRPTMKEFHDFILELEKIVVGNINRDFFEGDIPLESEIERRDGRIEIRPKGTIQLLQDWLTRFYHLADANALAELMKTPRAIAKIRQEPAHQLNDDIFDQSLFERQRLLMCDAFNFLDALRLIFSKHPRARGYQCPAELARDKIWTY